MQAGGREEWMGRATLVIGDVEAQIGQKNEPKSQQNCVVFYIQVASKVIKTMQTGVSKFIWLRVQSEPFSQQNLVKTL